MEEGVVNGRRRRERKRMKIDLGVRVRDIVHVKVKLKGQKNIKEMLYVNRFSQRVLRFLFC